MVALWLVTASMGGCSDEGLDTPAAKALRDQGLTPVEVGGYAWFDCGKGDSFATKFKARNAQGREVEGAVCSGIFKGYTIRYD